MPPSHANEIEPFKKSLQDYISHVKIALNKAGDKLNEKEKSKMDSECDKCLRWLENSSEIAIEEVVNQQKHLQLICGPYLAKLFGPDDVPVTCRLEAHRDDEDPSGTGGSGYSGKGTPGGVLDL